MQPAKGTFVGIGFILIALAILVLGYAIIWPGEYFWHNPPFESSSAYQDSGALFKDYVQEKAAIDKQHAEALRRNAEDTRTAKESKDSAELYKIWAGRSMALAFEPGAEKRPLEDLRQAALTVLEVELWHNLSRDYKFTNQELVEKYQETFSKRAYEERTTQLHQQGWIASIISFLLILLISAAMVYFGLRLLRRSAMPGTVFETAPKK